MQSLMWKEFTEEGMLRYPNFLETVTQIMPMYAARSLGGMLYLIGAIMMAYNLYKTVKLGKLVENEEAEAAPLLKEHKPHANEHWHRWIERRPVQLMIFSLVVILIGGVLEMVPTFMIQSNVPTISSVKPYTPLELQGRDLYVKEGCYTWGSKRTGPDLHRIGGKYPYSWHYNHMLDPTSMSPGSIMPSYPWMLDNDIDTSTTATKIRVMQKMGVPYPEGYDKIANRDLMQQADSIAADLKKDGIETVSDKEIIALIAYLQRLGTDIKIKNTKK
ncbi:MAG: cytochrome oxidase Cbb3 [Bacteroidetes bacterium]|nr:cytochrome oxidase Cbb3 [Bacteroidota bacterium]